MKASVVLASYNGEKYIREQIDSIIRQLDADDELVISDDGSSDKTRDIVEEYVNSDMRVSLIDGPKKGSAQNFISAISSTTGEIILFSDQDDLWREKKLNKIKECFQKNPKINLVMHDADFCNEEDESITGTIFLRRKPKHGVFRNLMYSTYYGCCMAARKNFLIKHSQTFKDCEKILPFDQYFGLLAEVEKSSAFLDEQLITHRYHSENQSSILNFKDKLRFRINLAKCVVKEIQDWSK